MYKQVRSVDNPAPLGDLKAGLQASTTIPDIAAAIADTERLTVSTIIESLRVLLIHSDCQAKSLLANWIFSPLCSVGIDTPHQPIVSHLVLSSLKRSLILLLVIIASAIFTV